MIVMLSVKYPLSVSEAKKLELALRIFDRLLGMGVDTEGASPNSLFWVTMAKQIRAWLNF